MSLLAGAGLALGTLILPLQASAQDFQPDGRFAPPPAGDYVVSFHLPEGGGPGFGWGFMMSDRTRLQFVARGEWEREEVEVEGVDETSRESSWHAEIGPEFRVYGLLNRRVLPFFHLQGYWGLGERADGTELRTAGGQLGLGAEWFPFQGLGISGQTGVGLEWSRAEPETGGVRVTTMRGTLFRSALSLNLYY